MLFVRTCPGCGATGGGALPCPACDRVLRAAAPAEVDPPLGLDRLVALHRYEGLVRALVLAAKNGGRRQLLGRLGADLAGLASGLGPVDVVTWVPASRHRARQRSYDQGRLLARAAGKTLDLPTRRLLIRRPGPTRIGAGRIDRLDGPDLRCPLSCPGTVLLVDDVVTTGASMAAAAAALRLAGADWVAGLVVAVAGDDPALGPFDPDDRGARQHYG